MATAPVAPPHEQAVVDALRDALAPTPVWWGYVPQEMTELPPSLPVVVVARVSAVVHTEMADMCKDGEPLPADVTLQVRVWHPEYAPARALQATVRATVYGIEGWQELSEFDVRDTDLRAWSIQSDWLAMLPDVE